MSEADPFEKMRRQVPDDFAQFAGKESDHDLRRRYGAGQKTVSRWRQQTGIRNTNPWSRMPNLQMPADFAEIARGMTVGEAAKRFNRNTTTVRRWFAYAGIVPKETVWVQTKQVQRAAADASRAGQAAQHLRRFYSCVHRADIRMRDGSGATWGSERGLPDKGRGHYFVAGLGAMPDYEMIALARDHGFQEWIL